MVNKLIGRRYFIGIATSTVVAVALSKYNEFSKNLTKNDNPQFIYSVFIVNKNHIPKSINNRIINLLPKTPENEAWLSKYNQTRINYIKAKKLLETKRFEDNEKITIIHKWSTKEDFVAYCRETNMNELTKNLSSVIEFQHMVLTDFKTVVSLDSKIFHHEIYS